MAPTRPRASSPDASLCGRTARCKSRNRLSPLRPFRPAPPRARPAIKYTAIKQRDDVPAPPTDSTSGRAGFFIAAPSSPRAHRTEAKPQKQETTTRHTRFIPETVSVVLQRPFRQPSRPSPSQPEGRGGDIFASQCNATAGVILQGRLPATSLACLPGPRPGPTAPPRPASKAGFLSHCSALERTAYCVLGTLQPGRWSPGVSGRPTACVCGPAAAWEVTTPRQDCQAGAGGRGVQWPASIVRVQSLCTTQPLRNRAATPRPRGQAPKMRYRLTNPSQNTHRRSAADAEKRA